MCYGDIKSLNNFFFFFKKENYEKYHQNQQKCYQTSICQYADLLKGTQPRKWILLKHMGSGTQELFLSLWQVIAGISQIKLKARREFVDGRYDRT